MGLESVNPSALKATGRKPQVEEEFEHAASMLAAEIGPVTPNVMFGMPGDNLDGFRRTLDYIQKLAEMPGPQRIRHARIHWTIVPPGSYFANHAERYGICVHPVGVPYVLGTEQFPEADLRRGLHVIASHPRSDLFVWEDAEPLRILGGDIPDMLAPGGGKLGAPAAVRIEDGEVLAAIKPLVPGRPMPRGWAVGPIERQHGFPVIVFKGPHGQCLRTQLRPKDTEPHPVARSRFYDIVCTTAIGSDASAAEQRSLLRALVDLLARNQA
jgi:hypothetical protein